MRTKKRNAVMVKVSETEWDTDFTDNLYFELAFEAYMQRSIEDAEVEVLLDQDIRWVRNQVFRTVRNCWELHDLDIVRKMEVCFNVEDWSPEDSDLPPLIIDSSKRVLLDGYHRAFLLCLNSRRPRWNVIDVANQPNLKVKLKSHGQQHTNTETA